MNIGQAVEAMKAGSKVSRAGWNGKGMWLIHVPGSGGNTFDGTPYHKAGLTEINIDAHIDMYTAAGTMQPGWLASQADLLAEDWGVVS